MKNIYQNIAKKLLKDLKKDFSFHNSHTELLAIWTVLFLTITGLFVLAIKNNLLVIFLSFILAIAITFATTTLSIFYLHGVKYHSSKRFIPKTHNLFNRHVVK